MPFDQLPHNYVLHSLHYKAKEPDATPASFLNNKKKDQFVTTVRCLPTAGLPRNMPHYAANQRTAY